MFAVVVLGHHLVTGMAGLVVLRLLRGAAEALYFVAGFAALADLAPAGRAGEALGLNSLALYLGVATGPLLGQALLRWGGFDLAWAGAVWLAALAALLATRVPETRPTVDPGTPATPLLHRAATVPGLGLFCGVAVMAAFLAFAVLQARAVGIEAWSLVLLTFGGTVVGSLTVGPALWATIGRQRCPQADPHAVAEWGFRHVIRGGGSRHPWGSAYGITCMHGNKPSSANLPRVERSAQRQLRMAVTRAHTPPPAAALTPAASPPVATSRARSRVQDALISSPSRAVSNASTIPASRARCETSANPPESGGLGVPGGPRRGRARRWP